MSTPILNELLPRRTAWRGEDFSGPDDIAVDLTEQQGAALLEVLDRVRDKPVESIRREECRHPALDRTLADAFHEVQRGRGLLLLRNVPVDGSLEDVKRIYWALGTHFGKTLSQNVVGHRLALVQEERRPGGVQSASGTKAAQDLFMHTDNADIFTLLCVRQAKSGGETFFSNVLAIHNEMRETRPDLLEPLYRGFRYYRRGEQQPGEDEVTPYHIPVFANVDGELSTQFIIGGIVAGFEVLGEKASAAELEALQLFMELSDRFRLTLRFGSGEMIVVNNYMLVHGRSEFVDWEEPAQRRLLMRLWLEADLDPRKVPPEIHPVQNKGNRAGVDPIEGVDIPPNEYNAVPEELLDLIKAAQKREVSLTAWQKD